MAYEYTELSAADKAGIARGDVHRLEADFFHRDLDKKRAEALPAKTLGRDEQIKAAEDAQAVILSALETTKAVQVEIAAEAGTEKA